MQGWKQYSLGDRIIVTAHPDLQVVLSEHPHSTLMLMGYILDAENPCDSDVQILQRMHTGIMSIDQIVSRTDCFSGRWMLVYHDINRTFLIGDAFCLRDVYYCKHNGAVWCASQPHLLAKILNIPKTQDPEKAEYFSADNIGKLHGKVATDLTVYDGIRRLLANYYLDLNTGRADRFKFNLPEQILPLHQVISENSLLMQNILLAAHNRFPLMLGCTAGYDSRVLLASCRNIAPELFFYIFHFAYMDSTHIDIRVPQTMFARLNLPYHILSPKQEPEAEFVDAYLHNTMYPNEAILPCTYEQYKNFDGYLNVSENTITMVKVYSPRLKQNTAAELAAAYTQPPKQFILDWMQGWITYAKKSLDLERINLSDLYFWEVFLSNLLGPAATEQDIGIDDLSPSNCRKFMYNAFSVDYKYHQERFSYIFHDKMIAHMWKELGSFPINPGLKYRMFRLLRKHNLYFDIRHLKSVLSSLRVA